MGFFSRSKPEPIVHPDRVRRIHLAAPRSDVLARLAEYDDLGGGGDEYPLRTHESEGWTSLVLDGPLHPWAFHNLALWLVDTPSATGVIAVAEPCDGHLGYWLVDDTEDSWLSGYDDAGTPITVAVPSNDVVVGEALAHPAATRTQALTQRGVPAAHHVAAGDATTGVRLEDPGHDLNPRFEATRKDRKRMRATNDIVF